MFDPNRAISRMPCSANVARWSGRSRRASSPPWIAGCNVLTRPSSISGNPVTAVTSVTGSPTSARARAAPAVETSATPRAANPRAKGTSPALSLTEISARRIGRGEGVMAAPPGPVGGAGIRPLVRAGKDAGSTPRPGRGHPCEQQGDADPGENQPGHGPAALGHPAAGDQHEVSDDHAADDCGMTKAARRGALIEMLAVRLPDALPAQQPAQ